MTTFKSRWTYVLLRIDAVIDLLHKKLPPNSGGTLLIDTHTLNELREDSVFLHAFFGHSSSNQPRIAAWVRKVFTEAEAQNAPERALRLVEEAIELAQACGVGRDALHRLVDYVLDRPVGDPAQEVAGTMVTLYALAQAINVDADDAFENEVSRIQQPEVIDRVRRRQHEKRAALVATPELPGGWRARVPPPSELVDVTPDGGTRLPPKMVEELGDRVWFLRGKTHWEAWAERDLEAVFSDPPPSLIAHRPEHISGCATEIARPCNCRAPSGLEGPKKTTYRPEF